MNRITIPVVRLDGDALAASLAVDALEPDKSRELKERVLRILGVEPRPGETPMRAWLRHCHEVNGIEPQNPAHPAIRDAVLNDRAAARTVFMLAQECAVYSITTQGLAMLRRSMSALELAGEMVRHQRACKSCASANRNPRIEDRERCPDGQALCVDYLAKLRAERF